MDLELEIKLLKEKVVLLEKVKELQEMVNKFQPNIPYVPYVPFIPPAPYNPWPIITTGPWHTTTCEVNCSH